MQILCSPPPLPGAVSAIPAAVRKPKTTPEVPAFGWSLAFQRAQPLGNSTPMDTADRQPQSRPHRAISKKFSVEFILLQHWGKKHWFLLLLSEDHLLQNSAIAKTFLTTSEMLSNSSSEVIKKNRNSVCIQNTLWKYLKSSEQLIFLWFFIYLGWVLVYCYCLFAFLPQGQAPILWRLCHCTMDIASLVITEVTDIVTEQMRRFLLTLVGCGFT